MQHTLYILTDCNRKTLHMGITDDMSNEMQRMKEWYGLFVDPRSIPTRLVYQSHFSTEAAALEQYKLYQSYTRMQSEKLIRKQNPNWQDLLGKGEGMRQAIPRVSSPQRTNFKQADSASRH
jgi:putative endonuclease